MAHRPKEMAILKRMKSEENYNVPVGTEFILQEFEGKLEGNIKEIETKIKRDVYTKRILTRDFFKDYERHKNGLIREEQVVMH